MDKNTISIETEKGVFSYESSFSPSKGDFVKFLDKDEIYITKVIHVPGLNLVRLVGTFEKPVAKPKK